jgi:hypothetical protein
LILRVPSILLLPLLLLCLKDLATNTS